MLSNKSAYRAEIDGLRAFAVVSVVIFHAFPSILKGGFIGVDVFFVISGFLISSHIYSSLDQGVFSFRDFFGRRIRRIFPALVIVMGCALAFGWISMLADEYRQLGKHVAAGAAFVVNFIFVDESGYFDSEAEAKPMLHLWSLAVEEQFYILWPIVLWLAWKNKANKLVFILLLLVLSFILNLKFVESKPIEAFFWPVGRLWELITGAILAYLIHYKSEALQNIRSSFNAYLSTLIDRVSKDNRSINVDDLLSLIGILILAFGVIYIEKDFEFPGGWALVPVLGSALIILAGSGAWINRYIMMNPLVVRVGLISYPLYLWHWPILSFIYIARGGSHNVNTSIFAVLVSLILANFTYQFVEKPFRFGRFKTAKTVFLVISLCIVGSLGYLIYKVDGKTVWNEKADHINKARNEWSYPDGLIKAKIGDADVFKTSEASPNIIFLGDSHIEQYSPRIVDLYIKGDIQEVAFITGGGCPPIPNVYRKSYDHCDMLLETFHVVLTKNQIDTVIIGGMFYSYFFPNVEGKRNQYYITDSEKSFSLSETIGIEKAKESFYTFLNELSKKYKVVVLLDLPFSKGFSPDSVLNEYKGNRRIPISSDLRVADFEQEREQIELDKEMTYRLSTLDIDVVNQSEKICPNGICSAMNSNDQIKYKDSSHMRPWFVIKEMNLLDEYLAKDSQEKKM